MDGGEEGRGVFGVSGRNAPPLFERKKSILDPMAQFVEVLIITRCSTFRREIGAIGQADAA